MGSRQGVDRNTRIQAECRDRASYRLKELASLHVMEISLEFETSDPATSTQGMTIHPYWHLSSPTVWLW
jgi:hypothetical protein